MDMVKRALSGGWKIAGLCAILTCPAMAQQAGETYTLPSGQTYEIIELEPPPPPPSRGRQIIDMQLNSRRVGTPPTNVLDSPEATKVYGVHIEAIGKEPREFSEKADSR